MTRAWSCDSKMKLFIDPIRDSMGNHKNKPNSALNEGKYSIKYLSSINSIGYFEINVNKSNGKDIFKPARTSFKLKPAVLELSFFM